MPGVATYRLTYAILSSPMKNRFRVKVIPRAKKNAVEYIKEGEYRVRLTAPPVDEKASRLLVKLLAKHFAVAQSLVRIVSGEKSRQKIVEVSGS